MGIKPKDVTDAELAVLQVLWQQGRCTIRQITELLYPDAGPSHYATVKKLLERLERKKCVRRNRQEMPHVFDSAIDLNDLVGRRLQGLADSLCGGSRAPLLMHLIQSTKLNLKELNELHEYLENLRASKTHKSETR